jgi:predicted TIM-barrel fold metal-dependent hydrolase
MQPSEYLRRHVMATFSFEDRNVEFTRQVFGSDGLAWASDYPHTDSSWPDSQRQIVKSLEHVPESEVSKIVGGNVARFYGLH